MLSCYPTISDNISYCTVHLKNVYGKVHEKIVFLETKVYQSVLELLTESNFYENDTMTFENKASDRQCKGIVTSVYSHDGLLQQLSNLI